MRLAQVAMAQRDTSVVDLCKELGIERVTLYRYVGLNGELRDYGKRVLGMTHSVPKTPGEAKREQIGTDDRVIGSRSANR